jgi:hypothetical protein
MKITYDNYTIILNLITLRIVHLFDLLRSKSSLLEYKKKTNWWSYHPTNFGCIIFSPTMEERKLITETEDTIWIWIIHVMIAKSLHYTIKFTFTSEYYVQTRDRPQKNEKCLSWRVLAENWFECAQKIEEKE